MAGASAEIGVLFMGLALVTGALWGRLTWGVFWAWDARLTTTAFLFVTYIGCLAVRRLSGSHHSRAKRSGIFGLLAVIEIPLVHFSVELWRSLHQEASVANPSGDVKMDGLMLFSLFVGIIAFTLLYFWLVLHRQRVMFLEDHYEDADLDAALAGSIDAIFRNQGEVCLAGSRLLVQRPVYDEFTRRFAEAAAALRVGDPREASTQIGPMVSEEHLEKVMSYIELGKAEGGRLLAGGHRVTDGELAKGNFVAPTVFADVDNSWRIAQEEIFGPVQVIIPFDTVDEAIEIGRAHV